MLKLGTTNITKVMLGSVPIKAIYKGAELVWQLISKIKKTVQGGTSATLTDVYDDRSLVLLQCQGSASGSGDICNLINVSDVIDVSKSGTVATITNTSIFQGKTLTLGVNIDATNSTGDMFRVRLDYYIGSTATYNSSAWVGVGIKKWQTLTVNVPSDATEIRIVRQASSNNAQGTASFVGFTMIEGNTCTEAKPYGYKIGVLVQSENLFNGIQTFSFFGNGSAVYKSTTNSITYEQGKTYTIRIKFNAQNITYASSGNLVFLVGKYTDDTSIYVGITTTNYANGYVDYTSNSAKSLKNLSTMQSHSRWTGGTIDITSVEVWDSTKTPIQLDTYIGATALTDTEKVQLDFEQKKAYRGHCLPSEYQELDYISKNNSTTYFDTNYMLTPNSMIEVDAQALSSGSFTGLFGTRPTYACFGYASSGFGGDIKTDASQQYSCVSTGYIKEFTQDRFVVKYYVNGDIYFNDEKIYDAISNPKTTNWTTSLKILALASNDIRYQYVKLYGFRVYENGVIKLNYVPCKRKSDGVSGLYDIVNGTFLENASTGYVTSGNYVVDTDLTSLNTTTLNATQTTFEGTTVIVDGSTNKVASMDVEYYASK